MNALALTIVVLFMRSSLGHTSPECENVSFLNPLRNRVTWAVGAPIMLAYSFNCDSSECKHELRVGTFRGRFVCKTTTKIYQKKNRYRVECDTKHGVVLAAIMEETKYPRRDVPVNVTLQGIECAGTGFKFRVKRCPETYTNKRLSVVSHSSLEYKSTGVVTCIDPERVPFSEGRPLLKNQTTCDANARWIGKNGIECWKGPKVNLRTEGSVFQDNEEVTFSCAVENGYPTNTTTWLIVGDRKIAQPGKKSFVVDHRYHNMPVYCVASNAFTEYHKTTVKSGVTILKILFPPTNFSSQVDKCSCKGFPQLCSAKFSVTFIANPLVEDSNVGVSDKNGLPDAKLVRLTEPSGLVHRFRVNIQDINKEDLGSLIFWANATILGHLFDTSFTPKLLESCITYTEHQTSTEAGKSTTERVHAGAEDKVDDEVPMESENTGESTSPGVISVSTTNSEAEEGEPTKVAIEQGGSESEHVPGDASHKNNASTKSTSPPMTKYVPRKKATGRMITLPYSRTATRDKTTGSLTTRPRLSTANTYIVIAVILLILLAVMLYFVVKAVTDTNSQEPPESKDYAESAAAQDSTQLDTA